LLLKNGANPNQEDDKGITSLHLSAYKGQDDNVEILLKHKADPNKKDKMESKELIYNINYLKFFGNFFNFFIIISLGVPLNYAIMEGQTNSVQALMDNKADLSSVDINKDSLL